MTDKILFKMELMRQHFFAYNKIGKKVSFLFGKIFFKHRNSKVANWLAQITLPF